MDDFKKLITFIYPHEAHLAKSYLEANGVKTYVKDELTVQVNNFYSNAIGGVKLMIKDSDYETGLQLLKDGGYIKTENEENRPVIQNLQVSKSTDLTKCPFCNSDNICKKKKISMFIVPMYFILGIFFPFYKSSWKCFDCDKEWRYKK